MLPVLTDLKNATTDLLDRPVVGIGASAGSSAAAFLAQAVTDTVPPWVTKFTAYGSLVIVACIGTYWVRKIVLTAILDILDILRRRIPAPVRREAEDDEPEAGMSGS